MPRIEREIVIHRPVEEVFDFMADGRNEPHYNPHMLHAEQTSAGPIGRGTRFRTEVTTRGRSMEMAYEITAYERPRRLASRLSKPLPVMDVQSTETFEPVPRGTRLRWVWEVEPRGVFRLMPALLTRMLRRRLDTVLANIKRLLDAQQTTGPCAQAVIRKPQAFTTMIGSSLGEKASRVGMLGTAALAAYLLLIRPRQLRWGAADEEVARALPGDDVVERPTFSATRAVTIAARPNQIWPWLVQMGFHRAGWYSYDWIDNLGRRSAERIIPELQHLRVGDLIPMSPGGKFGVWVKDFEPNRWLLWWDKTGTTTWLWVLDPVDETRTRLISRVRMRYL